MNIEFKVNALISVDQFIELLQRSSLADRRPVHDRQCMAGMIGNSNLVISAWISGELIGIARSMTDFHYACYLSDLAVHKHYQRCGVGTELQRITQKELGPKCKLILISAPAANTYYPKLGYSHNERCWVLDPHTPST